MPDFRIAEKVIDISRNAMLVDTNVLVAAFWPGETPGRRDNAQFVLNEYDRPLLIPSAVIVEAWGMIVGAKRGSGDALLTWLNLPGRATIVPTYKQDVIEPHRLVTGYGIDAVDAMLVELATEMSDQCSLTPWMKIATFDTRDFLRLFGRPGLRMSLFNMLELHDLEFGV
jgi:predicted nucleic acid-binding protein